MIKLKKKWSRLVPALSMVAVVVTIGAGAKFG
jgi:hypothetical protein